MFTFPVSLLHLASILSANQSTAPNLQHLSDSSSYSSHEIGLIARAICRQEAHVIRILRHPTRMAIVTEQHLLRALNANCSAAPVQILNDYEMRTAQRPYHSEMCVNVLVLAEVTDFQQHIFDPRMGAKQFQRYFVVVEGRIVGGAAERRKWLRDMFRVFWLKQVLNVVVIFKDDESGDVPKWFSYTPFASEDGGDDEGADDDRNAPATSNWHVPVAQDGAANGGGDRLRTIETNAMVNDLFVNRLGNVHRSLMSVSMVVDEVRAIARPNFTESGFDGVDGRVADLIRERMNATFHYFWPTRDFTGSNTTGVLGDLFYRFANFGFNAMSYVPSLHEGVVETTNSFERHDICILVPASAAEPTLYNLLHTMTPLTWAIVIASVCLMIVTYKVVQSRQLAWLNDTAGRERFAYTWLDTVSVHFQSFFGDSICTLPTSIPLRVLIWCWCLYSFLITTAFTAKLISSLVLPRHLDDIDTLQALSASPLNVIYPQYLNDTLWNFLADSDAQLLADLRDQMRPVAHDRFFGLLGTERTSNAYVVRNYMAKYVRKKHVDVSNGRSYYHLMHECLLYLPKVYLLEKGSAYVGHVNELLGRFNEMGFMVKWEEETMHRYSLKAGGQAALVGDGDADGDEDGAVVDEADIKVVITVAHLQTAFYLLAMGLMMATVAFGGERWWARRERRRSLYRVVYFDKRLAREYGCCVDS